MVTRRSFLSASSLLLAPAIAQADVIRGDFPAHEPELVQEVVLVAHAQTARLKELVGRRPALAKVSFDWGFGDWETPIDAASHIGNREAAEFLIANGARATILLRRHARTARRRQGVHHGITGHPTHPRSAQHHVAPACDGGWAEGAGGRGVSENG